ncbi:GDP-mannose 4,6-dehydratase [Planctomycetaceae bacterium]|jgi:UDP-glucose 4-epimerase|nr:GDP-mannose 4,6-dehydratase [Planctomycetaceae bacterium]
MTGGSQHCLVTGGAGFIGSHLTEELLAAGHRVTILDDLSTGREDNLAAVRDHENLTLRKGSITDPVLLMEVMRDVDTVYHLAAAVGVKLVADDPVRTIETNIYPTETLLRHAAQQNIRVFLASTSEVYGKNPKAQWTEEEDLVLGPTSKPRWAYGCSKAIDEFLALAYHRKFKTPIVIGRFFNVVGPRQVGHYGMVIPRFVDRALANETLTVYDDGQQVRCFAHVDDVVQAVIKLTNDDTAAGEVFNIGSDTPVTIKALAEQVIALTGSDSKIQLEPYHTEYGSDFEDVRRRVPDLTKLQSQLGGKPSQTLEQILQDVIAEKRRRLENR